MEEILERFTRISQNPAQSLKEWKQRSQKKIIGCLPMHFPEEMIHAAGMLPVITWESDEPFTSGYAHIQSFFCGVVRSVVDMVLKDRLSFLDGIVFPDTCLQVRGIKNIVGWNFQAPYKETLYLPPVLDRPVTRDLLLDELKRVRASLGKFAGQEISDEALKKSIKVYNRNRALLRQLYELRRNNPGLLRAREVLAIVVASMLMPKEEHSELLSQLLPQLRARKSADGKGVRLLLHGSLCEAPKIDLLDMIEEVGAVIVDDDLYTGSRYFVSDVKLDGDPLQALADHYLNMVARCPSRIDPGKDLGKYIKESVDRNKAQGVIFWLVKYCEPHALHYPDVKRVLGEAGVPELFLETDHEILSIGQIKTRLQAFIEMIGGA